MIAADQQGKGLVVIGARPYFTSVVSLISFRTEWSEVLELQAKECGSAILVLDRKLSRGEAGCFNVGETVRHYQRRCGMTQQELAERVGLDLSCLGGIEREQRNPTLGVIHALAVVLEVSVSELTKQLQQGKEAPPSRAHGSTISAHIVLWRLRFAPRRSVEATRRWENRR